MEEKKSKGEVREGLENFQKTLNSQAAETNLLMQKKYLKGNIEKYKEISNVVKSLPKKLKHDIMVPFGPMAFFPGQIYHSNEVLVLLGDGYFVEVSAEQAAGILERRLSYLEGKLEAVERSLGEFTEMIKLDHLMKGEYTDEEGNPIVEIREEYHSDEENEDIDGNESEVGNSLGKNEFDEIWNDLDEEEEQEQLQNNETNNRNQMEIKTPEDVFLLMQRASESSNENESRKDKKVVKFSESEEKTSENKPTYSKGDIFKGKSILKKNEAENLNIRRKEVKREVISMSGIVERSRTVSDHSKKNDSNVQSSTKEFKKKPSLFLQRLKK